MSEIRVEQLTKTFGALRAVDDVSFTFPNGQVTCLLGPSGCGKTTLMRIIAGLETQTAGAVYFGDQDVSRLSPSKRNIGMVFQYPVVYRGISVYRNIELPLQSMKLSKAERTRRVEDAIQLLGLSASANLDVSKLDNGTRQKVSVAREVARQPQFILFDEPITNVDAASKLQLKRSLKELTRSLSQTIVYVTHDQTEAMTLADQIALMEEGKIVQCAPPASSTTIPTTGSGAGFSAIPGWSFHCHALGWRNHRVLESPLSRSRLRSTAPRQRAPTSPSAFGRSTSGSRLVRCPPACRHASRGRRSRSAVSISSPLMSMGSAIKGFKAKVAPTAGERLPSSGQVNVELPLERVSLFDAHGIRIAASLHPAGAATSFLKKRSYISPPFFLGGSGPRVGGIGGGEGVGGGCKSIWLGGSRYPADVDNRQGAARWLFLSLATAMFGGRTK